MAEMRHIYSEALTSLAETNQDIVVLEADLMRASGTAVFQEKFPDRLFNIGVAEANMMGIAAGLSSVGKIPCAHTFVPFATRRCYDQLFISVNYSRQNVKIVGFDPGITAAFNGGTHMSFEDLALTRVIPDITIVDPADGYAVQQLLPQLIEHRGCTYMRLQRVEAEAIYTDSQEITLGKANVLADGDDLCIIALGAVCVSESRKAVQLLEERGHSVALIDMFSVKPLDSDIILKYAKKTGAILSCENHQVKNGLGSAIAEVLCEHEPCLMHRHGIQDEFGEVGTLSYLKERFKLTAKDIAEHALRVIKVKKGR